MIEGEYLSKTPQELLEQIKIIPKNAIFPVGITPPTVHRSICVPEYTLVHSVLCSGPGQKAPVPVRVAELGNMLASFGLPEKLQNERE